MSRKVILLAPNVHTGGGLVLLKLVLRSCPKTISVHASLDARARQQLAPFVSDNIGAEWVEPNIRSRLLTELRLPRLTKTSDLIISFNGMPPLFARASSVVVFLQNRLYLQSIASLRRYKLKTAIRLCFEILIFRTLRGRVSKYIVQTQTMREGLRNWMKKRRIYREYEIKVSPFFEFFKNDSKVAIDNKNKKWDFIYVADGEPHKNHLALIDALKALASEGLNPTLALTLGNRDSALLRLIESEAKKHNLSIVNLGALTREELTAAYGASRALIFPSVTESFGLPLLEARTLGLPIVAGELDYVRDVCEPAETFDPSSYRSIARAIRRFLHQADPPITLQSSTEFWNTILETQPRQSNR